VTLPELPAAIAVRRGILCAGAVLCAAVISSCSSPHVATVEHPPAHSPSRQPEKIAAPPGWTIVPDGGKSPAAEMYLIKNDGDAAMVLQEIKASAPAQYSLTDENVCVLGNLSMQNKLGVGDNNRRVLRLPSPVGDTNNCCAYVYSENALLRRVVVFRLKSRIFELELRQNNESRSLSSVIDVQMLFVSSLIKEGDQKLPPLN
jgi:hypothetical protein